MRLMFIREFDIEDVYCIWDNFLAEHMINNFQGLEFIDLMIVALVRNVRTGIFEQEDPSMALNRLLKYPRPSNIFDLIDIAYVYKDWFIDMEEKRKSEAEGGEIQKAVPKPIEKKIKSEIIIQEVQEPLLEPESKLPTHPIAPPLLTDQLKIAPLATGLPSLPLASSQVENSKSEGLSSPVPLCGPVEGNEGKEPLLKKFRADLYTCISALQMENIKYRSTKINETIRMLQHMRDYASNGDSSN